MNQPASKEPTMDEILSSIRQIIADDDEATAQKLPASRPAPSARQAAPEPRQAPPEPPSAPKPSFAAIDPFSDDEEDEAPLALSPQQIVNAPEDEAPETAGIDAQPKPEPSDPDADADEMDTAMAELVVPDDVAFVQDKDGPSEPEAEIPAPPQPSAPEPSFAQAAPMPDPDLSRDLAEELLEPATSAAVRSAMSRLNPPRISPEMGLGGGGLTLEAMIREMLRPMLKDWLDENLPAMVERIVAQEIERASRGS